MLYALGVVGFVTVGQAVDKSQGPTDYINLALGMVLWVVNVSTIAWIFLRKNIPY